MRGPVLLALLIWASHVCAEESSTHFNTYPDKILFVTGLGAPILSLELSQDGQPSRDFQTNLTSSASFGFETNSFGFRFPLNSRKNADDEKGSSKSREFITDFMINRTFYASFNFQDVRGLYFEEPSAVGTRTVVFPNARVQAIALQLSYVDSGDVFSLNALRSGKDRQLKPTWSWLLLGEARHVIVDRFDSPTIHGDPAPGYSAQEDFSAKGIAISSLAGIGGIAATGPYLASIAFGFGPSLHYDTAVNSSAVRMGSALWGMFVLGVDSDSWFLKSWTDDTVTKVETPTARVQLGLGSTNFDLGFRTVF